MKGKERDERDQSKMMSDEEVGERRQAAETLPGNQ